MPPNARAETACSPAAKKYICEGQPATASANSSSAGLAAPVRSPEPLSDPNLPKLPDNVRYDQTIISTRIQIPDEDPWDA